MTQHQHIDIELVEKLKAAVQDKTLGASRRAHIATALKKIEDAVVEDAPFGVILCQIDGRTVLNLGGYFDSAGNVQAPFMTKLSYSNEDKTNS